MGGRGGVLLALQPLIICLLIHTPRTRYGRGGNFDTGCWERFHKDVVVATHNMDAQRESGREERLFDKSLVWSTLESYQRSRDAVLALNAGADAPEAPLPVNSSLTTQFELGRSRRAVLSFALRQYAELQSWTEVRTVKFLNLVKTETLAAFVKENPLIPAPNPRLFDVALVFDMVLSTVPGSAVPVVYVASPNYLLRGPRYDSCEVSLGAVDDGREWAVRLICFFMCDLGSASMQLSSSTRSPLS